MAARRLTVRRERLTALDASALGRVVAASGALCAPTGENCTHHPPDVRTLPLDECLTRP